MADFKSKDAGAPDRRPEGGGVRSREDFLSLFKRGQEFTEELIQENERLRYQLASAQEELSVARRMAERDPLVQNLMGQIRALEDDRQRLLDHYKNVEEQNRDYTTRYVEIEEAHNNLANLYVSSYQLHSTLRFQEVVQIVCEILLNLIGAEQFALYVLDEDTATLFPLVSEGRPLTDYPDIKLGQGRVGGAVATREQSVGPASQGTVEEPLAVIPLWVSDTCVGALLLQKLLTQKASLSGLDLEIFSLLAAHASTALRASAQHSIQSFKVNRAHYQKLWQGPAATPEEA